METKIYTLKEAVGLFVHPGDRVVMGAALESLIPFAVGYEMVRQGIGDLTLIGPISDMLFDVLIGAGAVARVEAAWVGNVMMGSGYNFRRAVERGEPRPLEVVDHTNFTIQTGLKAASQGLPYLPTRTALGSSLLERNPGLVPTRCPFTGEPLVAVRAIEPDVAVLHVQRADARGNAHAWGNLGVTQEAAFAADRVLVVAEEIVPPWVIASDPNRTLIPGFRVSAVVEARWGSHPSPCQGYTNRDHGFYREYHRASRTREGFEAWLDEWVTGLADHTEYVERLRAAGRLEALAVRDHAYTVAADFGY
ncbi:CoA transferase subunit A [Deferrisoma camini]|uniref:CoA transferase subunit A n=1 Tax=Deferrisoma camini TaxID=1035120 RepID=UPI00046D5BE5|nr:CoA-transferase [Deferrisoma camini]